MVKSKYKFTQLESPSISVQESQPPDYHQFIMDYINQLMTQEQRMVYIYMGPVKRICVFEHSVMTNFNCTCPVIQRGQGSGFLSEGSSWLTACMSEQRRFWRDCADAQARLNLRCSQAISTKFAWRGPYYPLRKATTGLQHKRCDMTHKDIPKEVNPKRAFGGI